MHRLQHSVISGDLEQNSRSFQLVSP